MPEPNDLRADTTSNSGRILVVSPTSKITANINVTKAIAPEEQLLRYNGINGSMMAIVQFASPAVAGAILTIGRRRYLLSYRQEKK
jgi:hypothetical protein